MLTSEYVELTRSLASGEVTSKDAWLLESEAAMASWQLSVKEYLQKSNNEFFDYHVWEDERAKAILAYKRSLDRLRRKEGDREIVDRLSVLEGRIRPTGKLKITRARRKVISAIVRIASDSGRLYCSYNTLARKAGVSMRTACSVRSELEEIEVLERVRTGGKSSDGSCQSNKYTVKWCNLRNTLDIPNKWGTRYPGDTRENISVQVANVWYNYEGYAHYSQSERQRRRIAKRAQESVSKRASEAFLKVENSMKGCCEGVEAATNELSQQAFCAVTVLQSQKISKILQPATPSLLVESSSSRICTRQSRSLDLKPISFNLSEISQNLKAQLNRINQSRLPFLIEEVDQLVLENQLINPGQDNLTEAEFNLQNLINADKSLTITENQ